MATNHLTEITHAFYHGDQGTFLRSPNQMLMTGSGWRGERGGSCVHGNTSDSIHGKKLLQQTT